MKKGVIALIIIIIVALIIGGIIFTQKGSNNEEQIQNVEEGYVLEYQGKEIKMGTDFKQAELPKANGTYEADSCAIEGTEITYTYENFEVATNSNGNSEQIVSAYLIDGELATKEGVRIGDTLDKMLQTYGENYTQSDISYIYTKGNTELIFIVNNDSITSIEYRLIIE